MPRSLYRRLIMASLAWVLLVAGGAFLARPVVGPIIASIDPNPFWSVVATGIPAAPFRISLRTASWLGWCLAPVVALWLAALAARRKPPPSRA